jgi:hypothetical protein
MTGTRAPLAVARTGVSLAARALRTPEDRARYGTEFLAELYGLGRGRQLRHTAGVLIRILALRAALGSSPSAPEEGAMTLTGNHPPFWRCRVFHWHDWVRRSTEDGERYQQCARCGADRGPAAAGMMTTPPWPGNI